MASLSINDINGIIKKKKGGIICKRKKQAWSNSSPFLDPSKAEYDCPLILLKHRNQKIWNCKELNSSPKPSAVELCRNYLNHLDSDKERKRESADDQKERDAPEGRFKFVFCSAVTVIPIFNAPQSCLMTKT